MLPSGVAESVALIQGIDQCLVAGFTNLDHPQQEALRSLARVYSGTPLGGKLSGSVEELLAGVFQPETFAALAAGRAGLQGSQYDALLIEVRSALGRATPPVKVDAGAADGKTPPLLDSVRHWLMDLAITGFSRLDPAVVTAFFPTLEQLRADPAYLRTSALLTGFVDEMLGRPEEIPTYRWCDLWTRAMLTTFSSGTGAETQLVTGTLYPLGIAWRQHASLVSFVVYGVLEEENGVRLVRVTQTAFKVEAITDEQIWLLFPQAGLLLDSLTAGKALKLKNMVCLPGGMLVWDDEAASSGGGYKLMEMAQKYFAPGAGEAITQWELPAEQRHPIHIAEPVTLARYHIGGNEVTGWTIEAGGSTYNLDARYAIGPDLAIEGIGEADQMFGLLRFDAGVWWLQPLCISKGKGKPIFIGKEGSKVFKKPPKDSTVSILKERASRLLREKS